MKIHRSRLLGNICRLCVQNHQILCTRSTDSVVQRQQILYITKFFAANQQFLYTAPAFLRTMSADTVSNSTRRCVVTSTDCVWQHEQIVYCNANRRCLHHPHILCTTPADCVRNIYRHTVVCCHLQLGCIGFCLITLPLVVNAFGLCHSLLTQRQLSSGASLSHDIESLREFLHHTTLSHV